MNAQFHSPLPHPVLGWNICEKSCQTSDTHAQYASGSKEDPAVPSSKWTPKAAAQAGSTAGPGEPSSGDICTNTRANGCPWAAHKGRTSTWHGQVHSSMLFCSNCHNTCKQYRLRVHITSLLNDNINISGSSGLQTHLYYLFSHQLPVRNLSAAFRKAEADPLPSTNGDSVHPTTDRCRLTADAVYLGCHQMKRLMASNHNCSDNQRISWLDAPWPSLLPPWTRLRRPLSSSKRSTGQRSSIRPDVRLVYLFYRSSFRGNDNLSNGI